MDKKGINLKPILAVIKVKEMLIAILLLISMSLVQLRNLKIYLIGLVTFLLVSRLNGNFQVGNLYYITVYKITLRASYVHSLKEKRMIVRSITQRLKNKFNISI